MKKNLYLAAFFMVALILVGCAQKPQTANASEAISQSQQLGSVNEKVNFLVKEANGFVNSKQFDEAVNTAKYVLSNLDKNSAEAKTVLEKAQAELKKMAEQKMAEAKNALGNLGK